MLDFSHLSLQFWSLRLEGSSSEGRRTSRSGFGLLSTDPSLPAQKPGAVSVSDKIEGRDLALDVKAWL